MSELNREKLEEILPFMALTSRPDLRCVAMQSILGLSGTQEGRTFLGDYDDKCLSAVVGVIKDEQSAIAKDALLALVNLTTDAKLSLKLLQLESQPRFLEDLLNYALTESSDHVDIACMILSNLSRGEAAAQVIVSTMILQQDSIGFHKVIQVFCKESPNSGSKLHYLGPFLSNLTQIREARKYILNREQCVVQRLLPFTEYKGSLVRRGGIVGTLRNCCFESEYHEWLLSDAVDILPHLLLPLAGPEEFDDEDTEKLPDDLQYLQPDKQREADPDIRKMLVESVNQLCTAKPGRTFVRDKNTYVILRELDRWEKEPVTSLAIQNIISVLIADEPQVGMENLKEVEIPDDVEQKLEKSRLQQEREAEEESATLEQLDSGDAQEQPSTA